ncbi:MAG TPA: RagB/SusD family nutrient uptake outer membrane protein [Chitinophagaceae bacterium]|nr:RagB/SusD family nutrient uptake outer membrane protein [Chitinophagaceae bacterium]
MNNKIFKPLGLLAVLSLFAVSCTKHLDRFPVYDLSSAQVYKDLAGYKQVLAKVYAGLALTGNSGPDGSGDISGIDEGFSSYLRQYWNAQELSTDEAVIGWNDATIKDFHFMTWSSSDVFIRALYYRIFFQITLANEFIRESTAAKLSERGISGADATEIGYFRAEARFLRALSYYHALDLFGNVPFVTENDPVGSFLPARITRNDLFNYVESELLDIEDEVKSAKSNEYGRVDQGAVWALLSRLYLNAEVYTGTAKYTQAITYAKKVIAAPYSLITNWRNLFLADNHTATSEIIFPITFDGGKSRTWGGTTYLVHAPIVGSMSAAAHGVDFGWGGIRTTKQFVQKFSGPAGDSRMNFHTSGQNLEINDIGQQTDGYGIIKFRNVTSTGAPGSNPTWVDTDFPMFRLAEMYLNYAEAVLRGGTGGDAGTALSYINLLRQRAYGNTSGNITASDLTLQFILDERARELHWEAVRRTDLIRYGQFTEGTYLWAWKGNVPNGQAVGSHRKLYPIPASDVIANPNLVQNTGY